MASNSFTPRVDISINGPFSRVDQLTGLTTTDQLTILKTLANYAYGGGTAQANKEFYESNTSGAGSAVYIANALKDPYGNPQAFNVLKVFYLFNSHATNTLSITGANGGWPPGGTTNIIPGGSILLINPVGYSFSGGTTSITIGIVGSAATYDVVIIGS